MPQDENTATGGTPTEQPMAERSAAGSVMQVVQTVTENPTVAAVAAGIAAGAANQIFSKPKDPPPPSDPPPAA
jgi:hypothetical protein